MKTKLFLIQFFLPILLFGQIYIQLNNVSNVCTNMEMYEIYAPEVYIIKPSLAQTDIAWLSYGNNSAPISFADTLFLDYNLELQFYSLEVEKYIKVIFRLVNLPKYDAVIDDQNSIIYLYQISDIKAVKTLKKHTP